MKMNARSLVWSFVPVAVVSAAMMFAGCKSSNTACCQQPAAAMTPMTPKVAGPPAAPAVAPVAAAAPATMAATGVSFPLRIKAGASAPLKDAAGNTWLPEQGFVDGDSIERADLQIENTKTPELYRAEHYSMTAFSCPLPNGKYTVKLHFCETYDGIQGPGQRVFSFNVAGHEFKDFDVWVKAGGPLKAYVETVNVNITDGKLDISFTSNIENPQINAIEIAPAA